MYKGSIAIAGECMCTRPFSMHTEPGFLELAKILREADTTYCHLEMNIFKHGSYPGRAYAVSALQADPIIAKELKWLGIDMMSAAYNHALDWGLPGMMGTIDCLDEAGVVHAGIGNNLQEAREPRYFESSAGRVAIVAISSGHHPYDSASLAQGPNRGRPGVNPLRILHKHVLPPEDIEKIKELWSKMGLSQRKRFFQELGEGEINLNSGDVGGGGASSLIFKPGEKAGLESIPNKWDVEGNLRAITDASKQADIVLVAHHAATNDGERGYEPCRYVVPFAKQCIDAGADAFIGHGWHRQLGIELYNGKPIFYGTGNFFAQSQFMQRIPADTYEGHGFDPADLHNCVPSDLHDSREIGMGHWKNEPCGLVSVLGMDGGKFNELKLYPYSLGYEFGTQGKSGSVREAGIRMDGRPILTDGAEAEKIIDHVKSLSEKYNTRIEMEDGVGVVKL